MLGYRERLDMRALTRSALLLAAAGVLGSAGVAMAARSEGPVRRQLPTSFEGSVTVYSADWCGYCKRLQAGLKEQQIPFDVIDVDRNPGAHERAKQATGTSAIPVTSVARGSDVEWIVGADVAAVVRAYKR